MTSSSLDRLRLALVGTGFWSRFQIPAWKEVSGAQLVALCDRDVAKAREAAARFGVEKVYGDADEMLARETLDFVDIAANPEAHLPLVLLAARHKKPVICQKPMAFSLSDCERMVSVCREAGVPLFIHENFRRQAPMRRVHDVLRSGRIGKPIRAHIQYAHGPLTLYDNQPYLYTQPHFALFDMGPHFLDLPRFFFGEPRTLFAHEQRVHPKFTGEDVVSVQLTYDAMSCHAEMSWRTTGYEVFVEGTKGTVQWGPDRRFTVEDASGVSTESLAPRPYAWADPRYGFAHSSIVDTNAHLLAALRGEIACETTGEDNLRTMRLVVASVDSAARGEAIRVG